MYNNQVYWGKPIPGFGDTQAKLVVIGLAPGAHGSNRTGRMFTGDAAGDFLFDALYRYGFANQAQAIDADDDLCLKDVFITAVCRCAPPANKPTAKEIGYCQPFLIEELELIKNYQGIIALGQIAFMQVLRLLKGHFKAEWNHDNSFIHGKLLLPTDGQIPWIISSYHPSRQNTQTGRLTKPMFDEIWQKAREMLV